jgi:hypothetical protein
MNVPDAAMATQADFQPCGSVNVRVRYNHKELILEQLKLAQHDYEEGHSVGWDDARILEIESNSRYRKYKELAHMTFLTNPISQPSLDISPTLIPSSVTRSPTHREYLYDLIYSSRVAMIF